MNISLPTEIVKLPSRGLVYSENHPLASGQVEIRYMSAKEEDILTNTNYIKDGTVIEKLIKSLLVDKSINVQDFYNGDLTAVLISARILAFGTDYKIENTRYGEININLNELEHKDIDYSILNKENVYTFVLPMSKHSITFRLTNGHIEKEIEGQIKAARKIYGDNVPEGVIRLKNIITKVTLADGQEVKAAEFIDSGAFLTRDTKAFREFYNRICPDVDLVVNHITDSGESVVIPFQLGLQLLWPDAGV